ncbi:unnamed protein product [Allacma fusca]|uniref:Uncharacterized protein n=1 Tax=Allacma fusca TaxID=39272 RepID=A0A8J2Q6I2_9HEXA|nr:unnamed protein product [Allacma fusca]
MFALVDFVEEKDKDGTIPCEVVHFKWLSQDLKTCFWPGNKNYIQEFKRGGPPLFGWEECKVKTKFVSSVLSDVREFRAKHLNSTATDSEMDLSLISREIPTVMSVITLAKSKDKRQQPRMTELQQKGKKKNNPTLPKAPLIDQELFEDEISSNISNAGDLADVIS